MKIKLMALMIILSFIISSMLIVGMPQVAAAKGEQQPPQEQKVIDPYLEKILEGMSPSDNISVLVYLRGDPNLDRQIQAIWQGRPDDEMRTIAENLMQQLRKVSAEMYPYEQQLRAGDPVAIERYKELEEKYGVTNEDTRAAVQRLTELHDAKTSQIAALEQQAYAALHKQVTQTIEQLPDTKVTSSNFMFNGLVVETQAGNIQTLAAIPEIIKIAYNSPGILTISPYLGLALLSPSNGSSGCNTKLISFSWKPYEESISYKIVLAKDPAITQIIEEAEVTATSYEYAGTLDYGTNYFWRVMALEPAPSEWSSTFSFQTEAAPPPPEATPHSTPWMSVIVLGLTTFMAVAIGFIARFFIIRSRRNK